MKLHYTGCFLVFFGLILNFSTLYGQVPELLLPIGHSDAVVQASYSPDGERIATVSADNTVKIWNVETGRLLLTIDQNFHHKAAMDSEYDKVSNVMFSPNGKSVMTKSQIGSVRIWDSNSGKLLLNPSDPDNYGIRDGDDDADGFWNAGYSFKKVKYSPDGKYLFVMKDTVIIMWDVQSGKLHHILEGHKGKIQFIVYNPDGRTMLSSSIDGMVLLWDAKDGKMIRILEGRKGIAGMSGAVFSPDGKQILAVSGDGSANIWDAHNGNLIRTLEAKEGYSDFSGASFTPDGKKIMNASGREFKIWDPESGNLLVTIKTLDPEVCFSPDNQRFLLASSLKRSDGGSGDCLGLYDAKNGRLLHIYDDLPTKNGPNLPMGAKHVQYLSEDGTMEDVPIFSIYYKGFTPDGKNIIAISDKCRIWDAETRNLLLAIDGSFYEGLTALFTSDGKGMCIISLSFAGLYDRTNGRLLRTYDPPAEIRKDDPMNENEKPVYLTGLSPNGKSFYNSSRISKSVKIYSTQNGELKQDLTGHSTPVREAVFSADGKNILSKFFYNEHEFLYYEHEYWNVVKENFTTKVWDLKNGKIIQSFKGPEWGSARFGDQGKNIHTSVKSAFEKTTVNTWNTQSGKLLNCIELQADSIISYDYSPDDKTLLVIDTNYYAKILDANTGAELHRLTGPVGDAKYSNDSKNLVTTSWFGFANVWDVETGKLKSTLRDQEVYGDSIIIPIFASIDSTEDSRNNEVVTPDIPFDSLSDMAKGLISNRVRKADFSTDGKTLTTESSVDLANRDRDFTIVWDFQSLSPLKCFWGNRAAISPDGTKVLTSENDYYTINNRYYYSGKDIKIWDVLRDSLLYSLESGTTASFSLDGKNILTRFWDSDYESGPSDSAKIWDAQNGQLKRAIYFSGTFCDIDWENERVMIHDNSKLVFYDIVTGKELYSLIAIDSVDYVVLTPDKYYMCSKNAANKLSWLVGDKLYSFDQFDLQYNRPDIVLERLCNPDTALIKMYRKAYEKRLKKAGFNEKMFSSEWHTPEMKILNSEAIKNITEQSNVQLKICGTDSKYNLDRLLVWVNDVPVYGANGMSLIEEKTDSIVKTININLSTGNNNIKTSCINEKGVESFKESVDVVFNPQKAVRPDLYIIAMSVSDYKDNRYDLQYAAKDGKDIASLFSSLAAPEGGYGKVFIDTLFNKNAIRKNFFKLKQKLLASKVDDEVVVFVSGHGLLNKDLDFYYATYNIDFHNPQKNGISFDELESILDGIPARKKLLLMDACHSGEVDKEETNNLTALNTEKAENITFRGAVKEYSYKGVDAGTTSSGLSSGTTLELMQELFAGLDQGTGTTVISAAAGKGYALESPQWNNGIFTFTIINGLKNRAADKNKDGTISISELKDYSIKQVQLLTGGRQKPTARRESINYDWRIW